jgi:hypothetical protein
MLSQFIAMIGTLSPSVIYSALQALIERDQARTVTLRRMAPKRRWSAQRAERSMIRAKRRKRANSQKESLKLWTLRDCQMELLTECTMHAFDASVTPYEPARRSSNYPPGRGLRGAGFWIDSAGITSNLLQTLERRADMLPEGVPEIYRDGPRIEDGPEKILSYRRGSLCHPALR